MAEEIRIPDPTATFASSQIAAGVPLGDTKQSKSRGAGDKSRSKTGKQEPGLRDRGLPPSAFTPSLMRPEELESVLVQRHDLADRLVDLVRDSVLTPAKHYVLLVGPRGIGKTHLVALLYHRLRSMADLQDRLMVAWLREDEWGVASFLDLLMRIMRALRLGNPQDRVLAQRVESLHDLPPAAAQRAAEDLLKELLNGRTLLLLTENLDDLFAGMGNEGQHRLRAYLQESRFCTIVATSPSLFNGVSLRTSPFYGFFQIEHLRELNLDEAILLLTHIATMVGDSDLVQFLGTSAGRARVRAVHFLAGGNPRVYIILSQFLTRQSLDELVRPFMRMLDDLTPYYSARMMYLSPQQRRIVDFLADHGGAVQVKQIASHTFTTHQTISSQLKHLKEMGYVVSTSVGREEYYELREPMMRLCIELKKNRGEPIPLFVDFLRFWYTSEELEKLALQSRQELELEYLQSALSMTRTESFDPRIAACERDYKKEFETARYDHALQVADDLIALRGNAEDWARKANCHQRLGEYDQSLAAIDRAISFASGDPGVFIHRACALSGLGRHEEALRSIDRFLQTGVESSHGDHSRKTAELEERISALDNPKTRKRMLSRLRRTRDGHTQLKAKVAELYALTWEHRALLLVRLKRYEEAASSFESAIGAAGRPLSSLSNLQRAEALLALHRWNEASATLGDVLDREPRVTQGGNESTGEQAIFGLTYLLILFLREQTQPGFPMESAAEILVSVYNARGLLSQLGAIVAGVTTMHTASPGTQSSDAQWRDAWRVASGEHSVLRTVLTAIDAMARYQESSDRRVLLELPADLRRFAEQLLGLKV